jgi:hypothetical protein
MPMRSDKMGWMKNMVRNWLEIKTPSSIQIDVEQLNNFESQSFINNMWYRGEANELEELYAQLDDRLGNKHFWGSKPTIGMNIRKIHTGLPAMIIDTLADISTDDLNKIEVEKRQEEWDKIAEENNPKALLRDAVVGALVCGDGAFKWSIDTDISEYPIIEFYDGSRVDFEYERGRLVAITFKTKKIINKQKYTLLERYSKKDITYKLVNKEGTELDIKNFPDLASKYQTIKNPNNFMMALPVMLKKSKKYVGRGKSLLDGKLDNFDAFDEVWSQWMLALRKGQIKTYIPESLLPRDPETGVLLRGSDFDNDYISVEESINEDAKSKIETTQGQIQHDALLSTYITALDQCLTGLISPSTLGIDTKKIDNAEATREKEKTTLYKRNQIVEALTKIISDMVDITFKVYDTMNDKQISDNLGIATFGGYANPSFEAQIETVGKAKTNGIMSIETSVEELYGDTKDEKWKREEVQRIKNEQGIVDMTEPSINEDLDLIENENILKAGDLNDGE